VLVDAHRVGEIDHDSPLVTVALHRLLLAILHRNFGPRTMGLWRDLWQARKWNMRTLEKYFERHADLFYAFDAKHPFSQVPPMAGVEAHSVVKLIRECASGNNATLFDHHLNDISEGISPAVAMQHLLAFQLYAGAGGVSKPFNFTDAPLARGRLLMVIGENLFETLCLNLVRYTNERPIPWDDLDDPPRWERTNSTSPTKEGTAPQGYLDYLTFQVRRVHLVPPDESGLVRRCQIQQGFKFNAAARPDPFLSYQRSEERGYVPVLFHLERSTWRDSGTLFTPSSEERTRPAVFDHLVQVDLLRDRGEIRANPAYRYSALGALLIKKQPIIIFWRHERLPLPLAYLNDGDLRATLDNALAHAERVGRALDCAIDVFSKWVFVPEPKDDPKERQKEYAGKKNPITGLKKVLAPGRRYWPALDAAFSAFQVAQAEERAASGATRQIPVGDAFREWVRGVRQAAEADFRAMVGGQGDTARVLRARVVAEQVFYAALNQARDAVVTTAESEVLSGDA
jgi:CRISPR system Cascade subunit CasA